MSSILCKSLPGDILHWGHSGDYTGKDCTLDGGREIGRENPWQVDIHTAFKSKLELILIVRSAHQAKVWQGVRVRAEAAWL